jgi:hypothetical protein
MQMTEVTWPYGQLTDALWDYYANDMVQQYQPMNASVSYIYYKKCEIYSESTNKNAYLYCFLQIVSIQIK